MSDPFADIGGEYASPFATTSDEVTKDADTDVVAEPSTEPEVTEVAETSDAPETETSTEEAEVAETPETTDEAPSTEEEEPKVEDAEAAEAEAEARLADDKSPKWFKNAVNNVYKPKIDALSQQLEPFTALTEQYGSVEEVSQKLELLNKLETVRSNPQTGLPEKTTADFVQGLYEKDPQTAYQLINDLATLPSPETQGYTVLQEMFKQVGIDPAKLNEVKAFAANGYQLQQGQYAPPDADELALIPEHLHATYSSLSPEHREALLYQDERIRNESLEDKKLSLEVRQREQLDSKTAEERQQAEQQQREQQLRQVVETKGDEHFTKTTESVFTNFVDSLAKQANMDKMDSLMITNTVLNSFEPTLAGRQSLEMLKEQGIEVDPAIPTTINELQENAKHIAYYEAINDEANKQKAVLRQVELQEKLTAKGNKIIASLALKRAKQTTQAIETQNSKLAPDTKRFAATGTGATVNAPNADTKVWSDEDYMRQLQQEGFR